MGRLSSSAELRHVTTDMILRSVACERPLPLQQLLDDGADGTPGKES
jgi:hypothetical protein